MPLATVLLTPWAIWQGAPDEIVERAKEEGDDDVLTDGGNALEVSVADLFITLPTLIVDGNRQQLEALHPQSVVPESHR